MKRFLIFVLIPCSTSLYAEGNQGGGPRGNETKETNGGIGGGSK